MPLRNPRFLRTGVVKESTGRISTETSTSSTSSSTSHRVSTAAPQSLCPLNCRSSERESPLAMVTKLEPALNLMKKRKEKTTPYPKPQTHCKNKSPHSIPLPSRSARSHSECGNRRPLATSNVYRLARLADAVSAKCEVLREIATRRWPLLGKGSPHCMVRMIAVVGAEVVPEEEPDVVLRPQIRPSSHQRSPIRYLMVQNSLNNQTASPRFGGCAYFASVAGAVVERMSAAPFSP
jgi:hypothetical protein